MLTPIENAILAIKNVLPAVGNLPAAAKAVLEDELAAGEDIPADFDNLEHEALFINHGGLPAFGDISATVEDMLAIDGFMCPGGPVEFKEWLHIAVSECFWASMQGFCLQEG
jgi:hypothetical protein